ncbi:MAG: hypothetical protein HY541_08100 [Deltaproteobacteria bacterium]|nr:hypothetical protein [Deltaproteobacteria bacterium]
MKSKTIILFFLFAACIGCSQQVPLLSGLDQKDANQIMVLLHKNGIQTKRTVVEKQQEMTWSISVSSRDEDRARELLVSNHLPREKQLGLKGICKEAGLIPTPKTEKCRELLALKGEIINSLESIPGVVNADVVLNIPDKEDFPDENTPPNRPTASVTVEVSKFGDGEGRLTDAKIQRFVANAVAGMDERDVSVIISLAEGFKETMAPGTVVESGDDGEDPLMEGLDEEGTAEQSLEGMTGEWTPMVSVGGLKMEKRSAVKFKVLASLFLFVFALLSGALIFILVRQARLRQGSTALAPVGENAVLAEKMDVDEVVAQAAKAPTGRRPRAV